VSSDLKRKLDSYRRITAVLLLVIVILGSVALYYSPLLDGFRTKNLDPVEIYAQSSQGVVTVRGLATTVTLTDTGPAKVFITVLGTGFVVSYNTSYYIVTNFHVIEGVVNSTVTFSNGDAYRARIIGSDGYSDLAIISVNASAAEFHPLRLGSSADLKVGEPVVAIGNPFGLSGTITVGIVSQIGRTLQTGTSGGFAIADTIQFSAAVNPGNSGGPLINSGGMVDGMTTAAVSDSQGLGLAIPSDTISRELPFLIKDGSYNRHPYLGAQLVDMNYELSQAMKTNFTWGVLIESTSSDGPANKSGLRGGTEHVTIEQQRYIIGGDIIMSLDGNKIVNYDALATYLERHVISGQTVQVGIIRLGHQMVMPVVIGTRPPITQG
jgi:S1-C subfamily serine protease